MNAKIVQEIRVNTLGCTHQGAEERDEVFNVSSRVVFGIGLFYCTGIEPGLRTSLEAAAYRQR
ncbi:protein of unknown function [Shewanella benthica]|uniref:Uncharacterized protein n=1 Tax=Shewanella benthica TaxID=43661 RepID=A0A330LZ98_9GAMM|nr:protein of unknown function [Shewanella benthica]